MKVCARCGEKNLEGSVLCLKCGWVLRHTLEVEAVQKTKETHRLPDPPTEPELTLMIVTAQGIKPITLPFGQHITLGRSDSKSTPNIDLVPFGGMELGVSRLHAVIDYTMDAASITDLGSTNGTYLNNKKLEPFQARILRYDDELHLGKLVIYIYT